MARKLALERHAAGELQTMNDCTWQGRESKRQEEASCWWGLHGVRLGAGEGRRTQGGV